jgi:hypothetical protein
LTTIQRLKGFVYHVQEKRQTRRPLLPWEPGQWGCTPSGNFSCGHPDCDHHWTCTSTSDDSIHIISLPGLEEVASEALGGEVIPRSVLIADFEAAGPYLLCAMGDGALFNFKLDPASGASCPKCSPQDQPISSACG